MEQIDFEKKALEIAAKRMKECYETIGLVLGHRPYTDGELAMTNSLFIEISRKIDAAAHLRAAGGKLR
jgi:hypothetical protein